jgi:ABC-type branched-subunit amino acid transport system permease subunit
VYHVFASTFVSFFAAGALIFFLVWGSRKLSLAAQFLVLLAMGVGVAFLFLIVVQLPVYRARLATLLVVMVFIASPIAVRLFLRVLTQNDDEQLEVHKSGR